MSKPIRTKRLRRLDSVVAKRPTRGSLARQTLLKMGVRVAAVVIALTAVSYYHVMGTITRQTLDELENYMKIRGQQEQVLFDLARDNHQALKTELVARIHDYDRKDVQEEFARRYMVFPDRVMRIRPELFDGARVAAVIIPNPSNLDADLKRRVLASQDTVEQMGRALHHRFQMTSMTLPENITIAYWPEEPKAQFQFTPTMDFVTGGVFLSADPEHNPERKGVWSKMYRDWATKLPMISLTTPVYDGDRFVGVIGHDITLRELFDRTVNVHLEGAHNLIVDKDGILIAHPLHMAAIEKAKGKLNIADAGDPELRSISKAAATLVGDFGVVEASGSDSYLGVVKIKGPDWLLISVYPKSLLQSSAYGTARFVLLGGLVSLLLEMLVLYTVLRKHVAAPLALLLGATKRVASGNMDVHVDEGRDDELGELATSFNLMANAVRDREARQKRAEETLRQSEERFRLLFERSADALLLLDGEVFIDCNEAALKLWQCATPSDIVSKKLTDFSPERQPDGNLSAAHAKEAYRVAFDHGSHRFEWQSRRADGKEFPMEALITAIPFRGKTILFAVFRDITARKQAEEANLRLTAELAEHLEREIQKNEELVRLWNTVEVLSTPVLEVWNEILVLPIIGAVDDRRSAVMREKLLAEIMRKDCRFVIIDVTGIKVIDKPVADQLVRMVRAVKLLGTRCIVTGMRAAMAKTLVELGIELSEIQTSGNVRSALRECIRHLLAEKRRPLRLRPPR